MAKPPNLKRIGRNEARLKNIDITLKIGKGTTTFSIPEAQLLYQLVGRSRNPPENLTAACQNALAHPIDSPPLHEVVKPGETVPITVSDIT
jgi:nickel-dependent lactate racemase